MEEVGIIILAAGKGTRMKSDTAKVLHKVAGKCMVNHVIECARAVARDHIHVVVGHQAETVKKEILKEFQVHFALQQDLLGTGDAVKAALPGLNGQVRDVVVLYGDAPLIREKTIAGLVQAHRNARSSMTLLAVEMEDPKGYGRILQDDKGEVLAVREEADASVAEKTIRLVNSGIYCFDRRFLEAGIQLIKNTNSQAEYYLTDLVEIAVSQNVRTLVQTTADPGEVMGVNTLAELARAEGLFQAVPK